MKTYCQLESVLLSACRDEDVSDGVRNLCKQYDEFDSGHLKLHVCMLPTLSPGCSESIPSMTTSRFADLFRKKLVEVRSLFYEVERLLQLLLLGFQRHS
jgi:hypothetical protein